jgi:hypothetical protein
MPIINNEQKDKRKLFFGENKNDLQKNIPKTFCFSCPKTGQTINRGMNEILKVIL